jgi:Tetracyclin repressor-like, C-terminal domain
MVIDTLGKIGADPAGYPRTGVLRDDLIGLTGHMVKAQQGARGDAYRSLLGEAHRYPQLLDRFKAEVLEPRFETLNELLRDAAARGEVSSDRLTPVVLEVLHALIIKRTLLEVHDPTHWRPGCSPSWRAASPSRSVTRANGARPGPPRRRPRPRLPSRADHVTGAENQQSVLENQKRSSRTDAAGWR